MTRTASRKKLAAPTTNGDLGTLAMRQTAIVTLLDPRYLGEERDTGYRIEIESPYSNAARDVITGVSAPLKIVKGEVESEQGKAEPERAFVNTLPEQLIAVTRRWWKEGESTDTITLNGKTMQATPENVRAVYENPEFAWIARKVQADYLGVANFFGPPKTA